MKLIWNVFVLVLCVSVAASITLGIPELDLPSATSTPVEDFEVDETSGDNFLRAAFTNVFFKGFQELEVQELKIDFPNRIVTYKCRIPELIVNGHYKMDAQFVMVPLKGEGTFWFRLVNVVTEGSTNFTYKEIDGGKRYYPLSTIIDFTHESVTSRFTGLFMGDPVLQEAANAFVNDNGDALVAEMKPKIIDIVIGIGTSWIRRIMKNVKYDDLAGTQFA